jgi:hypothetical protein
MTPLLKEMIKVYWEMITFKRSPLDTPDSTMMLLIAIGLSLSISLGQLVVSFNLGKLTMPLWVSILMIISQLILAFLYIRFILWTQNKQMVWQKLMTCWVMMLFILDSLAFLMMLLILVIDAFGLLMVLQKGVIFLSIVVGFVLSFWQISFSVRLYQLFLNQSVFFAIGVYLGWFGLNFLYLTFLRTLLQI